MFILLDEHSNEIEKLCMWHWRCYGRRRCRGWGDWIVSKRCSCIGSNGNIKEGMQANVEVGETHIISNVCKIEVELQRIINMIQNQKIEVHGQENANGDVDPHAQIDRHGMLYLTY